MSYMWDKFNIKTFPAETVVFRDGDFIQNLSTLTSTDIDKKYDLPVHIIYVGEISGEKNLNININVENQPVFLSVDVKNKLPVFLNIFIKNTGKNSELRGHIMINNENSLNYRCFAEHCAENTGILLQNKLVAARNSISKMTGVAKIAKNAEKCRSEITFSALADKTARIEFLPAQRISSVPDFAGHSAAIYKPKAEQILYLRMAGLSGAESDAALRDAFINDFNLF